MHLSVIIVMFDLDDQSTAKQNQILGEIYLAISGLALLSDVQLPDVLVPMISNFVQSRDPE